MIGSEFGRYKIVERLGAGGMGEVYRAEDTTLGRPVALKFLAAHLLNDDEAKQRFLREARAAAAVRHPNICHVYEVGEENAKTFLAMDYLEGDSLEERIAKGPLPLKDALDIGRQVAEGLKAANEKGIVHRDIKPANIMVDAEGRATILDFGLARLAEASKLTRADQTVGTAAYMSPEQIQGADVDHRTDVWALGCVLYEMVTGLRPFKGQYDQALAYEIVQEEPEPLTGVRAGVPMELEFIVAKCLAKDAGDRYQHASEIAVDLRTLAEKMKSGRSTILSAASVGAGVPATVGPRSAAGSVMDVLPRGSIAVSRNRWKLMIGGLAVLVATLLVSLSFNLTGESEPPERPVRRFSFTQEDAARPAISPDGKHVVYAVGPRTEGSLWVRSMDSEDARELPGTEGAGALGAFWSPDSSSLGFASGGELKRVELNGGNPTTLCKLPSDTYSFLGGSWSPDGDYIAFSSGGELYEVAARGGDPKLLFERESGEYLMWPHYLPIEGESRFLLHEKALIGGGDDLLTLVELPNGKRSDLVLGERPTYSPSGHLIFRTEDNSDTVLRASPFSLKTLEVTGESFPIGVEANHASVARDGTLVYLDETETGIETLVWRNRSGGLLETVGQPQANMRDIALSPDERWVAVVADERRQSSIWIHDTLRSTKTRLTQETATELLPAWTLSGLELMYSRSDGSGVSLVKRRRDGGGEPAVLWSREGGGLINADLSRDERFVVYHSGSAVDDFNDISYIRLDSPDSEPVPFIATPANERIPRLSPDGRFLAYVSEESGQAEVYVRPFPEGDDRWQVSINGGAQPKWRDDGKELYYVEGDTMMATSVVTAEGISLGQPEKLFSTEDVVASQPTPSYEVSVDGERFLTVTPFEDESSEPAIRVIENWYEAFRDRE